MFSARIKMKCFARILIELSYLTLCQSAVLLQPVKNLDDFGASLQFKNQDSIGNYNFGYNEGHLSGGSFRRESGDAFGNKVGSYGLRDADGRLRIVNYVADANGFRADVQSNEPGVVPEDPASATINKPPVVGTSAISVPAAPVATFPVPPAVGVVPGTLPLPPPPPPPAPVIAAAPVSVPQYVHAVVPYILPYKAYPQVVVPRYYKPPYAKGVPIAPAPVFKNYVAIAPPGYALPYGYAGGKASLPAYQPLGYS